MPPARIYMHSTPTLNPFYRGVRAASSIRKFWLLASLAGIFPGALTPRTWATSLTITPTSVTAGGYRFTTDASPAAGEKLILFVSSEMRTIDITGGYKAAHLPALLDRLAEANAWGTKVECWVGIQRAGAIVPGSLSPHQRLEAPVAPFVGERTLAGLGAARTPDNKPLPYVQTAPDVHDAPILTTALGNQRYFFKYAGNFITDPARRGFDCTTYIGAAYGLDRGMESSKVLADTLHATSVLADSTLAKVREHIAKPENLSGKYLLWKSNHIAVVDGGEVMEFSKEKQGFAQTPLAQWHSADMAKFWLSKLP